MTPTLAEFTTATTTKETIMRPIFYITAFTIAAAVGAQADQPHRTLDGGCMTINVPTAIYAEALDAGVVAWLAAQCTYAPLTSPRPVARPWGSA